MLYRFVDEQKTEGFPIERICDIAGVSTSAYYDWKQHRDGISTVAEVEERRLVTEIKQIHGVSDDTYGSPRVTRELRRQGRCVNHKRVERLMRIHDIVGYTPKKHRTTTIPDGGHRIPDRVQRNFTPEEPDVIWCGDISYIRTWEGFLYFSFVEDLASRRILGMSMATHMRAQLVGDALSEAVGTRGGNVSGVLMHSDAGSQGGFNWLSQHFDGGGVDGQASWVDEGVDGEVADEVAGGACSSARHRARVLACDRNWGHERAGRSGSECVAGCRESVVPPWWWDAPNGSCPPVRPYLSFGEREEIAIMRAQGAGIRTIARELDRAPSTISRELRRNAATRGGKLEYRASVAQWKADLVAQRPKTAKLVANPQLREYVQDRLSGVVRGPDGEIVGPAGPAWIGRNKPHRGDRRWVQGRSPEQISNRLKVDFPDDEAMRISHEAIYQALYVESRDALKRELVACLRTGRALRVPRARAPQKAWAHVTPDVMISERPAEVEDRAVPSHWEGDLIIGLKRSAIGTLVERTSRFTMLIHLPREDGYGTIPRTKNGPALAGYGAVTMKDALASSMSTLPEQLRRSLTWDRGKELSQHAAFSVETDIPVYFADPRSPWQRGSNENTNGLLRQYFPKGTDLSRWSADEIEAVANALNSRPRKTLDWKTPAEALNKHLHSAQQAGVASTD